MMIFIPLISPTFRKCSETLLHKILVPYSSEDVQTPKLLILSVRNLQKFFPTFAYTVIVLVYFCRPENRSFCRFIITTSKKQFI